jgi:tetratricopeptide (TPR) repeat protein
MAFFRFSVTVAVAAFLAPYGFCFHIPKNRVSNVAGPSILRNGQRFRLFSTARKELSTAERERREEDRRRRERVDEVVPGKTSAVTGASDFAIDVDSTREQWMRQATRIEQEIFQKTELGMEMLRMLRLNEASIAFDRVFELKPDAYLWQAGIVKFYLEDWDGAAEIFSRCAATYETRFNEPASEERIWRNACVLKKLSSMKRKEQKLVEQGGSLDSLIVSSGSLDNNSADWTRSERRKVVRISLGLFQSSIDKDFVTTILSRASLRSICGPSDALQPSLDKKMWKISSWYYLGLHYDVLGYVEESKLCMKTALRLRPNANSDDLVHVLPMLHMSCRNWFDDEPIEWPSIKNNNFTKSNRFIGSDRIDPIFAESLRSSLANLRIADLQSVLRQRGLRTTGSKLELQKRVFESLIGDADFLL